MYDTYTRLLFEYIRDTVFPKISDINDNLIFLSGKVEQILFWVCLLVLLYIGYKFIRIRCRTI